MDRKRFEIPVGNPFAIETELLILSLLKDEPAGMYGLAMVEASKGKLKRGTIYIALGRLEERGLVRSVEEKTSGHSGLPRPRYALTGQGVRVLATAELTGISTSTGVASG